MGMMRVCAGVVFCACFYVVNIIIVILYVVNVATLRLELWYEPAVAESCDLVNRGGRLSVRACPRPIDFG